MTALSLTIAIARPNSRIQDSGLSARGMYTQRDQYTHQQLPIIDKDIITQNMTTKTQTTLTVPCPNTHEGTPFSPTLSVGARYYLRQNKGTSLVYCGIHS